LYGQEHPVIRAGRIQYDTVDLELAIRYATEAVTLLPSNIRYREALALYLVEARRVTEALDLMRPVADRQHPIYLLLDDLEALPYPASALPYPADAANFAQQQVERGRFKQYPRLRVRFYVVPMSSTELQEFYSRRWSGFEFHVQEDPQKTGGGAEMRLLAQYLTAGPDGWRPAVSKSDIPKDVGAGILLTALELRNVPAEMRRQTPAGIDLPADLGNVYCYLIVVNYRPFD
jgi:hypothetical protein